jgi:glucosamine--fructose-6-phosphate aminotransferase (isomerizing)
MCGIIGATGEDDVLPLLLEGLQRLEYRGYDSAGVALVVDGALWRDRVAHGKHSVQELATRVAGAPGPSRCGIGHTRWATHGRPSEQNAHPHFDCRGRIAVVHNGIIENHAELSARLVADGHVMASETDTEVVAHLIEHEVLAGAALVDGTRAPMRPR